MIYTGRKTQTKGISNLRGNKEENKKIEIMKYRQKGKGKKQPS